MREPSLPAVTPPLIHLVFPHNLSGTTLALSGTTLALSGTTHGSDRASRLAAYAEVEQEAQVQG